ncbi:MAG: hypothetical protein QXD62_01625 [Candidatus Woesearchaeota archaeon]
MIIALYGKKGSGKTTVAKYLLSKNFESEYYPIEKLSESKNIVLDSITPDYINNLFSRNDFFVIEIECDKKIRERRINEEIIELESENQEIVPDFKIFNNHSVEELYKKIDTILQIIPQIKSPEDRFEKTYNEIYIYNDRLILRPIKIKYYLNVAKEVAKRSTCLYVRYGAIIVKDDQIVSTGYVGAPRGVKSSIDKNFCLRRQLNIPSGTHYEICRSVHAEQNAIINAARAGVNILNGTMYFYGEKYTSNGTNIINGFPCFICKKMIINAGISKFISLNTSGKIVIYDVDAWREEWKENDMLETKERYFVDY